MSNFYEFLKSQPEIGENIHKNINQSSQQFNFSLPDTVFQELLLVTVQLKSQLMLNELLLSVYQNSFMRSKFDGASDHFQKAKSTQTKASQTQVIRKQNSSLPLQEKQESKKKKKIENFSGDEYIPQEQMKKQTHGEQNLCLRVPATIGHEILRFIKNNKDTVKRILDSLGIQHKKFFMIAKYYREKVGTVLQLKSIWLEESNKYAKAFRIISQFYLRKVKVSITFNSSVENYHKHMKYMRKARIILKNIEYV